ncbi:UNVERIFIED_CONTAM: hypothetical protein NCL1_30851 [Trichonephila clavipes]
MSENTEAELEITKKNEDTFSNNTPGTFKAHGDEIPTVVSKDHPVAFSKESDNVTIELDNHQDQSEESPLSQTVSNFLAALWYSEIKR